MSSQISAKAAGTAFIDQDFQKRGLKPVGFANPALYWMAQNGNQLSSSPFHQVTEGNNLAYPAGPGWIGPALHWLSFAARRPRGGHAFDANAG